MPTPEVFGNAWMAQVAATQERISNRAKEAAAMTTRLKYDVEVLHSPYGGVPPWSKSELVATSINVDRIVQVYRRWDKQVHPEGGGWSGHVRIVGHDGMVYYPQQDSNNAWYLQATGEEEAVQ